MNEQDMMHGMHYSGQNVAGWIATEKLDGCRAYWDGATMWARGGKAISIPQAWRETLPHGVHLDGELFAGYGNRQAAVNAARYGRFDDAVRFVAFDAPTVRGDYMTRYRTIRSEEWCPTVLIYAHVLDGFQHAKNLMTRIKGIGGEGLMLRHPELEYHPGRTDLMLKLK